MPGVQAVKGAPHGHVLKAQLCVVRSRGAHLGPLPASPCTRRAGAQQPEGGGPACAAARAKLRCEPSVTSWNHSKPLLLGAPAAVRRPAARQLVMQGNRAQRPAMACGAQTCLLGASLSCRLLFKLHQRQGAEAGGAPAVQLLCQLLRALHAHAGRQHCCQVRQLCQLVCTHPGSLLAARCWAGCAARPRPLWLPACWPVMVLGGQETGVPTWTPACSWQQRHHVLHGVLHCSCIKQAGQLSEEPGRDAQLLPGACSAERASGAHGVRSSCCTLDGGNTLLRPG